MRNGGEHSTLIIGGNEELILKTGNRRYDIGKEVRLVDVGV